MKLATILVIAAVIACGKDAVGPEEGEWDHTCDQAKLDWLHTKISPDYTPTWQLMQQTEFRAGSIGARFNVQNGQCVVTQLTF